jgi:hypothetical protein
VLIVTEGITMATDIGNEHGGWQTENYRNSCAIQGRRKFPTTLSIINFSGPLSSINSVVAKDLTLKANAIDFILNELGFQWKNKITRYFGQKGLEKADACRRVFVHFGYRIIRIQR